MNEPVFPITLKLDMFRLPNFMRIQGLGDSLDVGALFPDDAAASEFWDACKVKWIEHVAKRRNALAQDASTVKAPQ